MRLAVAATPEVAIPTLEWLKASKHNVDLLITRSDSPSGRGKVVHESPVAQWGRSNEVEVLKPSKISELTRPLSSVDLLLTIAFGKILPQEVLSSPKFGSVNMHFSLLPRWRGAAPVQRSLEFGDTFGGITVFALDEGMDTGPIYLRERYEYPAEDSAGTVLRNLSNLGAELVQRALDMVEAGVQPFPQEEVGVSYAPKITKEDARIEWTRSAEGVLRGIRAFTPEPGAWTTWRGTRFQITRAHHPIERFSLKPGEISTEGDRVFVGCVEGSVIQVDEVIPAGKNLMKASAWRNGARLEHGDFFGQ